MGWKRYTVEVIVRMLRRGIVVKIGGAGWRPARAVTMAIPCHRSLHRIS